MSVTDQYQNLASFIYVLILSSVPNLRINVIKGKYLCYIYIRLSNKVRQYIYVYILIYTDIFYCCLEPSSPQSS